MRVYSLLYSSAGNLKAYVNSNRLDSAANYLVIVHTDKLLKNEAASLAANISKLLPNAQIIGCSVGGIIYKGESLSRKTLISIIELADTEVKTASVSLKDGDSYKSPEKLTGEILSILGGADQSFLFTFYCPNYPFASSFVVEMNNNVNDYTMIGGGAFSVKGDLLNCPAYTVHGKQVTEDSLVIAKLSGKSLIANQGAITGIKSVGRAYKVTKSKEHRLIEIEGQPAKQWLNSLVGEDYLKENPTLVYSLPLIRKNRGNICVNFDHEFDLLTNDKLDGELFVMDEISENEMISAGYIDPESTKAALAPLCEKVSGSPAEALFAYSCLNRRLVLHNCAMWELSPFASTLITGAFLAGELISKDGKCKYYNMAFSVATLSENKNATVNLDMSALNDNLALQFDNLPLIAYLFSTANAELENEINESRQKLAENLVTDPETGLPNLTGYAYDSQNSKFKAACLLSLKNDSVIKVFLDKKNCAGYVKVEAEACKKLYGERYKTYRYGELTLLIAATASDKDAFIADMKKLKSYLSDLQYENYRPIYEMSVVFGDNEVLNKIEITYVNLHKGSGDMLVYSDDNGNFKKEMSLLMIINDAISHKRVIPYYQGIMNNNTKQIDIYESLMRIADNDGRIYMPGEFLPVAKEYKLYDQLSQMMIEKVLDDSPKRPFSVAINLNTSDIYNQNILNAIFDRLQRLERPDKIIFEIVESEEITDYDYLKTFTDRIHELGAKIAVDDFGSGYSNLMHVLRVDLDFIKITGDIVKDVNNDQSCRDFIAMISAWANGRDKKVIAEFVENEEIQNVIKSNKVAYSQGYLFSKPQKID